MAISRHDPEWKRVVFMALAGGVTFHQTVRRYRAQGLLRQAPVWYAYLNGREMPIRGHSKYDVARRAVHMIAQTEFLPDAAKERGPALPGDQLRS